MESPFPIENINVLRVAWCTRGSVSFRVISLMFSVPLLSILRGRMWYGEFVKFVLVAYIHMYM